MAEPDERNPQTVGGESPRTAVRGNPVRHAGRLSAPTDGSRWAFALALVGAVACCAASDLDEFKVKREGPFEFVQKPVVTRSGDRVTVAFETKAICDVTVAVEDEKGRIVRHLACGVLGQNAPEPFRKNAMKQTIVWDGKDDGGVYIDDKDRLTVRVSLGLRPRFERDLFRSPHKRVGWDLPAMCAAPEGVYVYDSGLGRNGFVRERLILFDHDGRYIRTTYPFPAQELPKIKGLMWRTMPQTGTEYPLRNGLFQNTLLTVGDLSHGVSWPTSGGGGATAFAVKGTRIALARRRLNRLATDGSTGGLPLSGPETDTPLHGPGWRDTGWNKQRRRGPLEAAFSADGKWVYLTGFFWRDGYGQDGLGGVARVPWSGGGALETFVGSLRKGARGSGDGEFKTAASVAVDAKGRVYVADYGNDRIQVFTPDGEHLRNIPAKRPSVVRVSPKTGEIYVFSWITAAAVNGSTARTPNILPPTLTRLGPFDDPTKRAAYPLDITSSWLLGPCAHAEVDFHTDPPTIWLCHRGQQAGWVLPNWRRAGIRLLVERGRDLVVKRDFVKEARREAIRLVETRRGRARLYFNPGNGRLYVGEADSGVGKSFYKVIRIDPVSGKVEADEELPFDTEDMAFDRQGRAYLRTERIVVRYDPTTWREVPFDYGESRPGVGFGAEVGQGGKAGPVTAGIILPSVKPGWFHMGGMTVSPAGRIAVACYNPARAPSLQIGDKKIEQRFTKAYTPTMFPGRVRNWEIHVFDERGRALYRDAVPGSCQVFGIGMDKDDYLYLQTPAQRLLDGKPYANDVSCVVFKVKAHGAKVLSAGRVTHPLPPEARPKRRPDLTRPLYSGRAWIEGAAWLYGGVGTAPKFIGRAGGGCWCDHSAITLDDFARTFVPENDTYSVAVLDSEGNLILRIGRYGNADDGAPLVPQSAIRDPQSIGGDEVALFLPRFVAADTDHRLFIADPGNARIVSVRLDYYATERVALKDVREEGR